MQNVLDAIQRSDTDVEVAYQHLIDQLAHDEHVPEAEAVRICKEADHTAQDVQDAVKRRKRILELESIIATFPEVESRRLSNVNAWDIRQKELIETLDSANRQLNQESAEFSTRDSAIRVELNRIRSARRELNDLTTPPVIEQPPNPFPFIRTES